MKNNFLTLTKNVCEAGKFRYSHALDLDIRATVGNTNVRLCSCTGQANSQYTNNVLLLTVIIF